MHENQTKSASGHQTTSTKEAMETPSKTTKKNFALSPAASVWTPTTQIKALTPKPKSALKLSAKEFVPAFVIPTTPIAPVRPKSTPKLDTAPVIKAPVAADCTFDDCQKVENKDLNPASVSNPAEVTNTPVEESKGEKVEGLKEPECEDCHCKMDSVDAPPHVPAEKKIAYIVMDLLRMRSNISEPVSSVLLALSAGGPGLRDIVVKNRKERNSGGRGRDRDSNRRNGRGRREHRAPPSMENYKPFEFNEETRWKSHTIEASKNTDSTTEVDEDEIHLRKAKSILNKLSIEKFSKLSDQFIEFAGKSQTVLTACIGLIVDKARMEWHFSGMYAELCCKLSCKSMPAMGDVDDSSKLFRKLLLQRCQQIFFEEPSREGFDQLSEEDRAESELKLKLQTLGHIRFIGELFKQNMLSSRIMHECIQRLFGDVEKPDEENLECLCKLLRTVGKKLSVTVKNPAEIEMLNKYYEVIQMLSQSKLLSTRIRFMLQDLLELKNNRWVARRKEEKATTIAAVHEEAAKEERKKNSKSRKDRAPRLTTRHSTSSLKSNPSQSDGWQTVPPKPTRSRSSTNVLQSSQKTQQDRKPRSASRQHRGNDKRHTQETHSKKAPVVNVPVVGEEKKEPRSVMSAEVLKKKLVAIMKELFHIEDINEAGLCIEELVDEAAHCSNEGLVSNAFNLGLDNGNREQKLIGEALARVYVKGKKLDRNDFVKGINEMTEFLEDIEIDIPLVIPYMGQMISPLVLCGAIEVSNLIECTGHLTATGKAAELILEVLALCEGKSTGDSCMTKSFLENRSSELLPLFKPSERNMQHLSEVVSSKFNSSIVLK